MDHLTARLWTHIDVVAYRHLGVSLAVKAFGLDDVLLLRTRGRRTGQVREVLVAYVRLGDFPIICGANGGWDRSPAWLGNLRHGGPVEIESGGRCSAVRPVVLEGGERESAFAVLCAAFPHLRAYATQTTRRFPVLRLEPMEQAALQPAGEPGCALPLS